MPTKTHPKVIIGTGATAGLRVFYNIEPIKP